ncbi:MAG: hypothetical protein PVJ41_06015 [Desulfobacterales bacterium]
MLKRPGGGTALVARTPATVKMGQASNMISKHVLDSRSRRARGQTLRE